MTLSAPSWPDALAHLLHTLLARAPAAPLFTLVDDGPDVQVTRGQAAHAAAAVAAQLAAAGLRAGDVALLLMPHAYGAIAAWVGTIYAGAIPTLLPAYDPTTPAAVYRERLAELVQAFDARAVITLPAIAADIAAMQLGAPVVVVDPAYPAAVEVMSLPGFARTSDDIAYLQFSSGTTGAPKAAAVSHANAVRNLVRSSAMIPTTAHQVTVAAVPLHQTAGVLNCLRAIYAVHHLVVLAPTAWVRQPTRLLHLVSAQRAAMIVVSNFTLQLLTQRVRDEELATLDLRCLRRIHMTMELITPETVAAFAQRFAPCGLDPAAFSTTYAATETGHITVPRGQLRTEWVSLAALQDEGRAVLVAPDVEEARGVVSCGLPLPDVTVRIVDAEGVALPERQLGEIWVQSDACCRGYWRNPELTAAAFRDDWYRTGDLGYVADGEVFVLGRYKDLIISGGRNVLPDALEEVVAATCGDVAARAVAFGVRDPLLGTERAVVVCETPRDPADPTLDAWARAARRAIHQTVGIGVADLRWVAVGWAVRRGSKVSRTHTRARYLAEFGAPGQAPAAADRALDPEARVIRLFQRALGSLELGLDDNFFDLGGDSLGALQLILEAEAQLGIAVSPAFLQSPTPRALLRLLQADPAPPPVPVASAPLASVPVAPARSRSAARPAASPRALLDRLRDQVKWLIYARPYPTAIRSLRWLCGQAWLQDRVYAEQVALFRAFYASLGGAKEQWAATLQRCLMNNFLNGYVREARRIFIPNDAPPRGLRTAMFLDLDQTLARAARHAHTRGPDAEADVTVDWLTVTGFHHLLRAQAAGQGVLVVTYHHTLLIPGLHLTRHLGYPLQALGQMAYDQTLREWHLEQAPTGGAPRLPQARAYHSALAVSQLRRRGIVALATDIGHASLPLRAPVGGRWHPLPSGVAELAVATGASIIPTSGYLAVDGRMTLRYHPPLTPATPPADLRRLPHDLMLAYGDFLDQTWRADPAGVMWPQMRRHLAAESVR